MEKMPAIILPFDNGEQFYVGVPFLNEANYTSSRISVDGDELGVELQQPDQVVRYFFELKPWQVDVVSKGEDYQLVDSQDLADEAADIIGSS